MLRPSSGDGSIGREGKARPLSCPTDSRLGSDHGQYFPIHNVYFRRPTCRSHAVCTAYHVLRSLKLPTAALHVVECTFRRGFKSYSATNNICLPHSRLRVAAVFYRQNPGPMPTLEDVHVVTTKNHVMMRHPLSPNSIP